MMFSTVRIKFSYPVRVFDAWKSDLDMQLTVGFIMIKHQPSSLYCF